MLLLPRKERRKFQPSCKQPSCTRITVLYNSLNEPCAQGNRETFVEIISELVGSSSTSINQPSEKFLAQLLFQSPI